MIGGALVALGAAIITAFFIPLSFKDGAGEFILAFLGVWFFFLFFFASPYMLWKRHKNKIGELEGRFKPKLRLTFDPDDPGCTRPTSFNNKLKA
ncbi:MAG: hypothetical protein OEY85_14000, partial [Rhodospirillales bacterium]|nr:hypothetical protein [Rhodospirillales bacterium]